MLRLVRVAVTAFAGEHGCVRCGVPTDVLCAHCRTVRVNAFIEQTWNLRRMPLRVCLRETHACRAAAHFRLLLGFRGQAYLMLTAAQQWRREK
jgi:hypothetical protein